MVLKPNAVVDIAKPGPQLQNLTGMWNARVLDGFTPFVVQFKENGLPVNLTNLTAFIEGDIGEGHYDSATDDVVMTGTPKSVRYTDDGSGNTNMGIVVFRLPPQFFIQTGIFKGFIGLQSSTGIRSTSNDVWFKVLGNSYTMGISCKYFISDFQKALDQANGKIDQALSDLYNKYNQKVGQAESRLDSFLTTLKSEQKAADDLSTLIKQTNDYISTNNIVTRSEYDKLANEIVTKLSQINVTPNYYKNYDDMVAQNPSGTGNLCVTSDTQHKWLYVNKQWLDLGDFSYADISPDLKKAVLTPNPDNLILNSDFKTSDFWTKLNDSPNTNMTIDPVDGINNSNVMTITSVTDGVISVQSNSIKKSNSSTILSFQVLTKMQSFNQSNAAVGFDFYDKDGKNIQHSSFTINPVNSWTPIYSNISIPAETDHFDMFFWVAGQTIVKLCRPQVNYGDHLLAYSFNDGIKRLDPQTAYASVTPNPDNLIPDSEFKTNEYWHFTGITGNANGSIISDTWAGDSNVISLNAANNETISVNTDVISINNHAFLSYQVLARYFHGDTSTGNAAIGVNFFDDDSIISKSTCNLDQQGEKLKIGSNGIFIPKNAKAFQLWAYLNGEGNLRIAHPQATFKINVPKYSIGAVQLNKYNSENLITDSEFLSGDYWEFTGNTGNANGSIIDDDWAGNSKVISLNAANDETISVNTSWIDTKGLKNLSWKVLTRYYHGDASTGNAVVGINFRDRNNAFISKTGVNVPIGTAINVKEENVVIPNQATKFQFYAYLKGEGNLRFAKPLVNFGAKLVPYDLNAGLKNIDNNSYDNIYLKNPDNVLPDTDFRTDSYWQTLNVKDGIVTKNHNDSLNNSNFIDLKVTSDSGTVSFQSPNISIENHRKFSFGLLSKLSLNGGNASCGLNIFDSNGKLLSKSIIYLNNQSSWHKYASENNIFPDNSDYIQFWIYVGGKADLQIARPQLNYGENLLPYSASDLRIKSAIPTMKIIVPDGIADDWHNGRFVYEDNNHKLDGFLQIGIQGNSSRMFEKKNLKIKLYSDNQYKKKMKIRPKSDWDKNFKFNLKANWVDFTQSRNLMGAKLVADAERVTPIADEKIEQALSASQNMGQMEGFPIELFINNEYRGMYTWNTKKDDKTFGMDSDNKAHEVISVGQKTQDHMFFADTGSTIDEKTWNTEIQDTVDPTVQANFTNFINWLNKVPDADFAKELPGYIDVGSVLNTMLFGIYSNEYDYYCKSLLLATYDQGKTYYMLPYDMDSTWGGEFKGLVKNHSIYDGAFDLRNLDKAGFVNNKTTNLLFSKIYTLMLPLLKQQWKHLRRTVWTTEKVVGAYKHYINSIPPEEYEKDLKKWPDNPSAPDTSLSQIQAFILGRTRLMDKWLGLDDTDYLPPKPPIQATDNKPTSTDAK